MKEINLIIEYIFNNKLEIDKVTYLTIVIGQLTIYGILLTFYQFVASFQGSQNSMTRYLGVNLTEYFIKKKVSIYNRIISKPIFFILLVIEVLYKPMLTICGSYFSEKSINVMNFIWYTFVIFYFIMFIILFGQCTKSILTIKRISDAKRNGGIIRDINKSFMKKSIRDRLINKSVDLLNYDIEYLRDVILEDNDPELQSKYNYLIDQIFSSYISNKEKEILLISQKNKIVKNQIPWVYNANCECTLINGILDGKYFPVDEELITIIYKLHIRLVELLMKRAKMETFEHICHDYYRSDFFINQNNLLDCGDWKQLTVKIYKNSNIEVKKRLIKILQMGYLENEGMYQEYCSDCITYIIRSDIDEIFNGKKLQNEFVKIFGDLIQNEKINDYCADIIRDNLISYDDVDVVELLKLLNKENCTCVFSYIIIYYSIYKFRFDWKYINITVIEELWRNHGNLKTDSKKVLNTFKESNIEHRFSDNMYYKLVEYLHKTLTGSLLELMYTDKLVDMFYITIIKLCVMDHSYLGYVDKAGADTQINFINELSKHSELMKFDEVKKMVGDMQYNYFMELKHIPQNLKITFGSLLLTNLNLSPEILSDEKSLYSYYSSIGKYALIKLSETTKENSIQKELIRKAYVASNMPVDEYIEFLDQECGIWGNGLNYVQKEKMKEYLISII